MIGTYKAVLSETLATEGGSLTRHNNRKSNHENVHWYLSNLLADSICDSSSPVFDWCSKITEEDWDTLGSWSAQFSKRLRRCLALAAACVYGRKEHQWISSFNRTNYRRMFPLSRMDNHAEPGDSSGWITIASHFSSIAYSTYEPIGTKKKK